jgi:hypothetical protein
MKHILIADAVAFRKMIMFAVNHDAEAELGRALLRLFIIVTNDMVEHHQGPPSFEESAGDTLAVIGNDFAPHSLRWAIYENGHAQIRDGKCVYNGGFIYQGLGQPGDGSFPALTVSIGRRETLHSWGSTPSPCFVRGFSRTARNTV